MGLTKSASANTSAELKLSELFDSDVWLIIRVM